MSCYRAAAVELKIQYVDYDLERMERSPFDRVKRVSRCGLCVYHNISSKPKGF